MVYRPPNSADLVSQLARDYAVQVNTSEDPQTPSWVFVRGLSQVTPSATPNMQDDGDIDAEGYGSQIATGQAFSMQITGVRKGTGSEGDFTPDPGQEFLRKKGEEVGARNIIQVRYWRTDDDTDAKEFSASVEYTTDGGDKEALQAWSATLHGRGRPIAIEKPTGSADDSTPSVPVGGGSGNP